MADQQFQSDIVKQKYIQLGQAAHQDSRGEANKYLMELQFAPQAWQISQELINNPQTSNNSLNQVQIMQIQFLGSQIIYQKSKTDFASLNDSQIQELRNYIFNILQNPEQLNLQTNKAAIIQLCAAIGVLGLASICTNWPTMIDDIIKFMQMGTQQMILGLEILEGFAKDINVIIISNSQLSNLKKVIRGYSEKLFEIFNGILSQFGNDINLIGKTLECLTFWAGNGTKLQIFEDKSLTSNIINIFVNNLSDDEILMKCRDLFEKIFDNSYQADLIVLKELDPECEFSEIEKQNHALIIQMLANQGVNFQKCMNDKELNPEFCKVYAFILRDFALYYNVYLLDQQYGPVLLPMLIQTVQHKSLKISQITLDFWCEIKKKFRKQTQHPGFDYLIETYKELLKAVLYQSRYRKIEHKKHEEDEKYFYEDVKLSDYRLITADVILQCLGIFKQRDQSGGIQYFESLVQQLLNTNSSDNDYLLNIEVALFAVASVFDDDHYFDKSSEFMVQIFNIILSDQFPVHYFVVSQTLQFIYEGCLQIRHNQNLLNTVMKYILKNLTIPEYQGLASTTLVAVADGVEDHEQIDTIRYLIDNIMDLLSIVEKDTTIENIVTGVFTICLKLKNIEHKKDAIKALFNIVQTKIDQFSQLQVNIQDPQQQKSATILLNILSSIYKGFDIYQSSSIELVKEIIQQFSVKNMSFINSFFTNFGLLNLRGFITLIKGIIKRCSQYIPDEFTVTLNQSIQYLQQDTKNNNECIQVLFSLFESLQGKNNQAFNNWISSNLSQFHEFMISSIQQGYDVDIIKEWVKVLKKSSEYSATLITQLPNFQKIMNIHQNILETIVQYELNREQLLFLNTFVNSSDIAQDVNFQSILPALIKGIFIALPLLSQTLLHHVSIIVSNICLKFQTEAEGISNIIFETLQHQVYGEYIQRKDITQQLIDNFNVYKQTVSQGIVKFGLMGKPGQMKIRGTLGDLHQVINRQLSLEDAQVALQFKLNPKQQIVL